MARAKTQSAFLFSPVEVVETYELIGHSAKEAEKLIHRALRSYHAALRVTGPDGRSFSATEWFKVSPELVEAAIRFALG
ncbi:GIY-YIG nuclease family protein [Leisingera sp. F5]|uniref:GIY-YIG nuclease family protein n=1 Tax=Leisingera sp. F5 TaxID=1813816 RepID=UPI00345C51B6